MFQLLKTSFDCCHSWFNQSHNQLKPSQPNGEHKLISIYNPPWNRSGSVPRNRRRRRWHSILLWLIKSFAVRGNCFPLPRMGVGGRANLSECYFVACWDGRTLPSLRHPRPRFPEKVRWLRWLSIIISACVFWWVLRVAWSIIDRCSRMIVWQKVEIIKKKFTKQNFWCEPKYKNI